jgi:hypothetical protein
VNGFLKRNIQEFIYQYRGFTKSIISSLSTAFSPQLQYLQNHHPLLRSEGGNLQADAAQLFLIDPIPAKAKKLGLLSIYKFSLRYTLDVHTAGCGKGYTLNIHTTGRGKRYTLNVHTTSGRKGYTLDVHTASGGKEYTLDVHIAGCGKGYTLHVHTTGGGK